MFFIWTSLSLALLAAGAILVVNGSPVPGIILLVLGIISFVWMFFYYRRKKRKPDCDCIDCACMDCTGADLDCDGKRGFDWDCDCKGGDCH